jgi:hypothetical protein
MRNLAHILIVVALPLLQGCGVRAAFGPAEGRATWTTNATPYEARP